MAAQLIISSNFAQFQKFLAGQLEIKLDPHPDLIYINQENQSLKIETIRDLAGQVFLPPYSRPQKVIILAHFDRATIPAQNAFLKMLEEHPDYIQFFLQAGSDHQILATIKSRCVVKILPDETGKNPAATAAIEAEKTVAEFIALCRDRSRADLIAWCSQYKDRELASAKFNELLAQLHHYHGRNPDHQFLIAIDQVNQALNQLEQNTNVLLTLENCLFTIKSRF